jgi:acylphosphatase
MEIGKTEKKGGKTMIVHILFDGRVQGVGFRYSVMQKALEHGIKGWVRNNDDGMVEMEGEGTEEQIKMFVGSLHTWPNRFIKVTNKKITYLDIEKGYKNFSIVG